MKIFSVIVFVFFSLVSFASAQSPAAPGVRIADAAMPSPVMVDDAAICLTAAAKIFEKPKDAAKYCLNARRIEAERSKKVANEAADAAQAARPVVVDSPYGYGRRRYYGGGCRWPCGYGYGY